MAYDCYTTIDTMHRTTVSFKERNVNVLGYWFASTYIASFKKTMIYQCNNKHEVMCKALSEPSA